MDDTSAGNIIASTEAETDSSRSDSRTTTEQQEAASHEQHISGHEQSSVRSGGVLSSADPYIRTVGASLLDTFPALEAPMKTARRWYAHAYVTVTKHQHNLTHEATIDPYRVVWVDPDRIEYISPQAHIERFRRLGATVTGDWDRDNRRFTDTDVYRAFETHFEHGQPWEETAFFQNALHRVHNGITMWGSSSRAELEERFERIDELYDSIRANGFLTQRELVRESVDDPLGYRRKTVRARVRNDEIAVNIGRDGTLLFEDGQHRLSIAKLLGVDEIPVIVLIRHEQWVEFRDAVAEEFERTGTLPDQFADHPDIEPLVDE